MKQTVLIALVGNRCWEMDKRNVSLLVLLGLSRAFDTINHDVLQTRLSGMGPGGTVLQRPGHSSRRELRYSTGRLLFSILTAGLWGPSEVLLCNLHETAGIDFLKFLGSV